MMIRFRDAWSTSRRMPGGFPQGCLLGMFMFIIVFTGACLRPLIPRPITDNKSMTVKFVDDCTIGASFNLKKSLVMETEPITQPVTYSQRTGHKLSPGENIMQYELDNFSEFASSKKFIINEKKT